MPGIMSEGSDIAPVPDRRRYWLVVAFQTAQEFEIGMAEVVSGNPHFSARAAFRVAKLA